MAVTGITLTLHPYDYFATSTQNDDPIIFNQDPFYIEDGSVDISEPDKVTNLSSPMGQSILFNRGASYGSRTVDVIVGIKDYENDLVKLLFRYINNIDYLGDFVNHPLGSLEVNLGTNSTSGATYRGYLKVLSVDVSPTSDIYEVGHAYNQDIVGQRHRFTFTCDPFFYKYPPTNNRYESINIHYPNSTGTGWIQGTIANITPSNYPCFYITPDDIEGDVTTPLIVRVANPSGNSGTVSYIYAGTNLVKSYPNLPTTDTPGINEFWEYYWDSPGENLRTIFSTTSSNAILDYKLSGKVYGILLRTSGGTNLEKGSYTVGITYRVVSEVDVNTLTIVGNATMGDLGIYFIPSPANRNTEVYRTRMLELPSLANKSDLEMITMPAWGFRKYSPKGYNLSPGESLIDNPYDNTVYVSNGGIYYHGEGSGLYTVPGLGIRGALIAKKSIIGGLLFDETVKFSLAYNPRYLNIRNIV